MLTMRKLTGQIAEAVEEVLSLHERPVPIEARERRKMEEDLAGVIEEEIRLIRRRGPRVYPLGTNGDAVRLEFLDALIGCVLAHVSEEDMKGISTDEMRDALNGVLMSWVSLDRFGDGGFCPYVDISEGEDAGGTDTEGADAEEEAEEEEDGKSFV